MADIYAEMHRYRIACCEANAKVAALQAENAKLKTGLHGILGDIGLQDFDRIINGTVDFVRLRAENAKLKKALKRHKHTDDCFNYAAKTAMASGVWHCIASCTDSRREALEE
jgi:hypothetical protein